MKDLDIRPFLIWFIMTIYLIIKTSLASISISIASEQIFRVLSVIIALNGVFVTILLTYLISKATWHAQEQMLYLKNSNPYVEKLTAFRKVCWYVYRHNLFININEANDIFYRQDLSKITYWDYIEHTTSNKQDERLAALLKDNSSVTENDIPFCFALKTLVYYKKSRDVLDYPELEYNKILSAKYPFDLIGNIYENQMFSRMEDYLKRGNIIEWQKIDNTEGLIIDNLKILFPTDTPTKLTNEVFARILDDFAYSYIPDLVNYIVALQVDAIGMNKRIVSIMIFHVIIGIVLPVILLLINALHTIGIISVVLSLIFIFIIILEIMIDIRNKTALSEI